MLTVPEIDYRQYLRMEMMPHILCPGCGHGIVLKAILRAIHRLGLRREEVVFVSGIGCSSRLVGYIDFCTLHTTHGRPLTFATGLKLARPDLRVVVITGDGDGLAIGGNHLIHAARRNIGVTCLLLNNAIYGMTGGQGAPTTPEGALSKTNPDGTIEPSFDACKLALGAGATFVARGFTATPLDLDDLIGQAIQHQGFSFVEIFSDCPEYFGRYNALGKGPDMLQAQFCEMACVSEPLSEKRFVPSLEPPSAAAEAKGVLPGGLLHQQARPEFATQLRARAAKAAERLVSSPRPRVLASPRREQVAASPRRQEGGEYHIRLAGEGGQGIVLAGLLLAEAAVAAGKNATHAQAYGPESRGGASKAEVIVSDGAIDYPYADRVDLLLALTQEAYEQYLPQLKPDGILVVDAARVTPATPNGVTCHALPITAAAQQLLGTTLGANLVALGALIGLSQIVPGDAAEQAVAARKPGGNADSPLRALRAGLALAATAAHAAGSGPSKTFSA